MQEYSQLKYYWCPKNEDSWKKRSKELITLQGVKKVFFIEKMNNGIAPKLFFIFGAPKILSPTLHWQFSNYLLAL